MKEELIKKYLKHFQNLNRGYNKGLGKAPHKPILLLSILQLIQENKITSNRIFITSDLILKFRTTWRQLVETNHVPNFALPFFHLRSEPFWFLVPKPGSNFLITSSKSIKSFKNLKETVAYAEVDNALFTLLKDTSTYLLFEQLLLESYFPYMKYGSSVSERDDEEHAINNSILNESSEEYRQRILELRHILKEDEFEEEIFIRGGLFKKRIPEIYHHTCCISGFQIRSTRNIQMVDACHILPFSLSNDDTIPNGIALSPTMHRAFDRGFLTINQDFRVRVSPTIAKENPKFALSQFEGQEIILPEKEKWYPSQQSLIWHNKEIFLL